MSDKSKTTPEEYQAHIDKLCVTIKALEDNVKRGQRFWEVGQEMAAALRGWNGLRFGGAEVATEIALRKWEEVNV